MALLQGRHVLDLNSTISDASLAGVAFAHAI